MTFDPNESEACTSISIIDDGVFEGDETFDVCVKDYDGVTTTITILDNDGTFCTSMLMIGKDIHCDRYTFSDDGLHIFDN